MREREKHKTPTALKTSSKTSFDRNFSSLTFSGFNISSFVRRGRREGSITSCSSSSSEEGGDSVASICTILKKRSEEISVCVQCVLLALYKSTNVEMYKKIYEKVKRCVSLSLSNLLRRRSLTLKVVVQSRQIWRTAHLLVPSNLSLASSASIRIARNIACKRRVPSGKEVL